MKTLRFILGDQLSHHISSLKECDKENDIVFMCEVNEEATYVKHHPKKIALIFSAMRHFADELSQEGFSVDYIKLDDPKNTQCFEKELKRAIERHHTTKVIVTHPGEYRVLQILKPICTIIEDDRFFCSKENFLNWTQSRKELRMEYFYREMRKTHNILVKDGKPTGGKWNYDHENRNPIKAGTKTPKIKLFNPDKITKNVLKLVKEKFGDHFGDLEPFNFAVTRKDALKVLKDFVSERLSHFGDYQDAMLEDNPYLYHSLISFYLNCGLLLPKECVDASVDSYKKKKAPLNAVEGFVRQILGWREYIRGIYWLKMPRYKNKNFFNAKNPLPDFFWSGKTDMNCLKQCISDTKKNAYAHHIQRLMVIGNFMLLAGIDPAAVNEWYLLVYADAYEWVELPNVNGMILFSDGGVVASKPYAASGAYINKMSDYCKGCAYRVSEKNGETACPFNYLYWNFLLKNQSKLENNQRMKLIYSRLKLMDKEKIKKIKKDAQSFLKSINSNT